MKTHLQYLRYVLRHKWYVYLAGRKLGVSLWRLLVHDASKFSRAEWGPYVDNFYGLCGYCALPWRSCHYANDHEAIIKPAFDRAWLHHQHRNPHHWQHWILREDRGETKILPMPEAYAREMVADWFGAGRAIRGKWEAKAWYWKNRDRIRIHPTTRAFVESLLDSVTL